MKALATIAVTTAILSGCKINVSGSAVLVDTASKKSTTASLSLYSKNTKKPCSIDFRIADSSDETLYELNLDAIYVHDSGDNFIDSSLDDCSKDSAVIVKATSVDKVIARETFLKPVHCYSNARDRVNGSMGELRHVKVTSETIVTDIEGQIIDKTSKQVVKTFTARSEPRVEAASSEGPNCQ